MCIKSAKEVTLSCSNMLQRYMEIGDHTRSPGQDRNRATSPAQDYFLRLFETTIC